MSFLLAVPFVKTATASEGCVFECCCCSVNNRVGYCFAVATRAHCVCKIAKSQPRKKYDYLGATAAVLLALIAFLDLTVLAILVLAGPFFSGAGAAIAAVVLRIAITASNDRNLFMVFPF